MTPPEQTMPARPRARAPVERPAYMVESVHNALVLLNAIRDQGAVRVSEAAREIGVADSTAHRLLSTLAYHGYVAQDADRRYRAGPLVGVGPATSELNRRLRDLSFPEMCALSKVTEETVNVVVRTDKLARVIASVESPRLLRAGNRVGHAPPARSAAGGKVLLAELDDSALRKLFRDEDRTDGLLKEMTAIRALGHASAIDEVESGLSSVAVCLRTVERVAVGALVVALPTGRYRGFIDAGGIARIHETARRIETSIEVLGLWHTER
ncbi:DNA-binding transcriptional regulator, IclR family [Gordonia westfalica]|uniref:DNA-binding transcriptional regulator, IclR family n=1 Tax=Gordonia westfalica TaxID=158898 RepID=A0A1H2LG91_9ACTN|nr:DNA-binding transcriptional regulator, IclR family [Gordonia westfalica]